MNSEDFEELYGEPRMTMAQLWLEEQWIEGVTCPNCGKDKEWDDELCLNCDDQEIIQEWQELEIPGDPPPDVENAIRREQVRLAEEI